MEVAPADKGSDRGRRVRGARGERTNFRTETVRRQIWMLLTYVNVTQDLEGEAEAEHQQGVGSQPREWGINTLYQLNLISPLVYIQWSVTCFSQDLQSRRLSIGGWDRGRAT